MRKIWSAAAAFATVAALSVAAPAASVATGHHDAVRARVIATFGTSAAFAESATLDRHGNAVVSVTHWGETDNVGRLYVVRANGHKTQFGPDIALGGCAMILGVDLDARGDAYVAVWNYDPGTCANSPDSGLLKVTAREKWQLTTLPADTWPNGVDVVGSHAYVTDSLRGAVWKVRIDRVTSPKTPWLVSSLLTPSDDPKLAIGADGVLYRDGTVWLTSYAQGLIVKVHVRRDGSAGRPVVLASDPRLVTADGIVFDRHGTLWVAVNHRALADSTSDGGHLVTVSPRGTVRDVAFAEGRLDYPTQPLFVGRHRLLVVNGSYDVMKPNVTLFTR